MTGWDIIFLWVARMVMAGYEWEHKRPFDHVYFTGMVRDKQRRKMSKSLGNSPDALKLIEDFGADGVRFGMLLSSPAGGDLLFDEKLVEQGRNFCNKIWNALRLVDGWETDENVTISEGEMLAYHWMVNKMNALATDIDKNFKEYRLSEALMSIYSFVWSDFCSWYLEMVKPNFGEKISIKSRENTIQIFSEICSLMHPFMPFVTEEIWHQLKNGNHDGDCIISTFPKPAPYDQVLIDRVEQAKDIITNIRDVRNKNGIKMKDELDVLMIKSDRAQALVNQSGWSEICIKLGNLRSIQLSDDESLKGIGFISGTEKCVVILQQEINLEAELEEKIKELEYQRGFVASVQAKLSNERFVSGAPEVVVAKEKAKLADGMERIRILDDDIRRLQN